MSATFKGGSREVTAQSGDDNFSNLIDKFNKINKSHDDKLMRQLFEDAKEWCKLNTPE